MDLSFHLDGFTLVIVVVVVGVVDVLLYLWLLLLSFDLYHVHIGNRLLLKSYSKLQTLFLRSPKMIPLNKFSEFI